MGDIVMNLNVQRPIARGKGPGTVQAMNREDVS